MKENKKYIKRFLPLQLYLCCILFFVFVFFFGETPTSHQNQQRYNKLPIGIQFSFNENRCNLNPTILNNVFFMKFVGKVLVVRCIMFLFLTSLIFLLKSCSTRHSLLITLFNAQFYPDGLKAYTRNIYKQRTQVK